MIEVRNLSKSFGANKVLNDISFQVKEGEVVAIIGPSGSGKSTLLRSLNLLEEPDEGVIKVGDVTVDTKLLTHQNRYELRQQSAMVFQHFNLFKNKTVLENVTLALTSSKRKTKAEALQIAEDLLEQVGLSDQKKQYPATLSGGQQQRVSIARALAVNPKVIFMDEPTSALDPELVGEVLKTIEQLSKRNITLVIVTHEMKFAKKVADKIVFMNNGVIVESGAPEAVFSQPKEERTRKFLLSTREDATLEYVI
ncbi:amino acid ABC transporter ATP-binding protein [Trichococcus pasteurii]|uniref:Abc transporter n=1 Tax=Trichococcus pasteurii TaxID=43064 RepID=A0A1W1ID26_9LACT|nr:amino acid ABC transporter ATP-binding protein [Trichococcus pasteurii]SFF02114.1 putative amino-acid transport system ATP-binding protein [Trichococcus pasteurii]SLM50967.1 abc transporter [Trichococcus pasteurii]SSB91848.1 abc transporter [Trichococcus pasteurii]